MSRRRVCVGYTEVYPVRTSFWAEKSLVNNEVMLSQCYMGGYQYEVTLSLAKKLAKFIPAII